MRKSTPHTHRGLLYANTLAWAYQVLFDTLSSLKTIHSKGSNNFKGDEFYGLLDSGPAGGKSVQMIRDNEAHAARRKLLDRALPPRDQIFHDINQIAQRLVLVAEKESDSSANGAVDVATLATWYSFDVISTLTFDSSLDMLRSQTWRWVPYCLQETSKFFYLSGYSRFLELWKWLLTTEWPSRLGLTMVVAAQQYADLAGQRVKERSDRLAVQKEDGKFPTSERKDIFGHLIRHGSHSGADLNSESSLLIAAGSDAVRLVIASTVFYLLKNPPVLHKIVAEVRALDSERPEGITESDFGSLKYLHACVDEAMRLTPPKPSSTPRETDKDGLLIDGILIPEGMNIGVSIYALHRDPEIFKHPLEYRPERWLERPLDPRMLSAFFPFLKGPRACPGRTVAYFAIQLALYHLVRAYDLQEADCEEGQKAGSLKFSQAAIQREYPIMDWIVGYGEGPFVKLSERV